MINHQATYDGADGHPGQHQDREEVAQPSAPRSSEDRADGPDDQEPREPCILRLEADAGNITSEEASAKQGYSQSDVAPRDGRHHARVSNIALMVRERHGAAFSTFRCTNDLLHARRLDAKLGRLCPEAVQRLMSQIAVSQ
jgi:hypothetical protein